MDLPDKFSVTVLPLDVDRSVEQINPEFLCETCILFFAVSRELPQFMVKGVYRGEVGIYEPGEGNNSHRYAPADEETKAKMLSFIAIAPRDYQKPSVMNAVRERLPVTLHFIRKYAY